MSSAHHDLQHQTTLAAARAAFTPELRAIVARILTAIKGLQDPAAKLPKRNRTAHTLLRAKACAQQAQEAYHEMGAHFAAACPAHWHLDGWNIRFASSSQTATWAQTQGRGQNGITIKPQADQIGFFLGFMLGVLWMERQCDQTPEAELWADLAPEQRSDWPFLLFVHNGYSPRWIEAQGRNPRDAYLRYTASHPIASTVQPNLDDGFEEGFCRAVRAHTRCVLWSASHLWWSRTVQSPAGQRLLGISKAKPQSYALARSFASTQKCYETFMHAALPSGDEHQQWQDAFLADLHGMRTLADIAVLAQPLGQKSDWIVVNGDDPKTPVVVHTRGWSVTSALLHASLNVLLNDKVVPDLTHWQAWPLPKEGDTKPSSLQDVIKARRRKA